MLKQLTHPHIVTVIATLISSALLTLILVMPNLHFYKNYQVGETANVEIISQKQLHFETKQDREKNRASINQFLNLTTKAIDQEENRVKILQELQDKLLEFSFYKSTYNQGQAILKKGEIIQEKDLEALSKLSQYTPNKGWMKISGIFLFTLFIITILRALMVTYIPKQHKKYNRYILCLTISIIMFLCMWFLEFLQSQSLIFNSMFLIPFPLVAIILTLLVHAYFAFVCLSIMTLLASLSLNLPIIFLGYMLGGSLVVILLTHQKNKRQDVIKVGYFTAVILALLILCYGLITVEEYYLWYIGNMFLGSLNGVLSAMLSLALLPYFESIFAISTNHTLMELADLNHPLLKRLMLIAPGTYQHSIMVANLAETAAESIKANPIICRTGGYFHDIGKIKRPLFFSENQKGDNPHTELNPRMSKTIIAAHTKEGVVLAQQYKLPKIIIELIREHHGTSLVSFFYKQVKHQEGNNHIQHDFRYPGPKPHFKESGILMLADSIEAGIRSLKKPSLNKIESTVDEIIKDKIQDGQLDNCPLNLKEIATIKESFLQVLKGMHHKRLDYQNEINQLLKQDEDKIQTI
ncbi:MAG: HDIG domain-containing metalloprotein [bacterium]